MTTRLVPVLIALALLGAVGGAFGSDEIQIDHARLEATEEGYALSADLDFELPARLEDALVNGVPLYFLVEFELQRPRWYWRDERIVQSSLRLRLAFHALTRQYRLSSGTLHQSFSSLEEALRALSRLRGWPVIERAQVRPGNDYDCFLRVRLDPSELPRPFQVRAITQREWSLASSWKRWRFTPAAERSGK